MDSLKNPMITANHEDINEASSSQVFIKSSTLNVSFPSWHWIRLQVVMTNIPTLTLLITTLVVASQLNSSITSGNQLSTSMNAKASELQLLTDKASSELALISIALNNNNFSHYNNLVNYLHLTPTIITTTTTTLMHLTPPIPSVVWFSISFQILGLGTDTVLCGVYKDHVNLAVAQLSVVKDVTYWMVLSGMATFPVQTDSHVWCFSGNTLAKTYTESPNNYNTENYLILSS